ncbi:MAG: hypothetical protein ACLTDM_21000 [Clostridium butyricum]
MIQIKKLIQVGEYPDKHPFLNTEITYRAYIYFDEKCGLYCLDMPKFDGGYYLNNILSNSIAQLKRDITRTMHFKASDMKWKGVG